MAITKTVLKKTKNETVIKLTNNTGTSQTATIDLQTDCLLSSEELGATQAVNIVNVYWTGQSGSNFTLTRNSVKIIGGTGDQPQKFSFEGEGFVDSINNTYDIVATMNNEIYVYLTLRKTSGYISKIETAQFSIYDDTNAVGS
jgi:hypothetical protein